MPTSPAGTGPTAATTRDVARLTLLAALVGLPTGLVALAFLGAVHEAQHLLWDVLPDALGSDTPPGYLVVGLPVLGAVLVAAARRLPGDGGHGPVHGLDLSPSPPSHAAGVALAAGGSLAFGAVLGPEAPLIALGSLTATWVTRRVRLAGPARQGLGVAGAAGAMSTVFGGPLVAGVLLLEAGGAAMVPAVLLPALVAAAVSFLLVTGVGDWAGIPTAGITVPDLPVYDAVRPADLLVAVAVGAGAAVLLGAVHRGAVRLHDARDRVGRAPLLIGSGLAVGLLAWVAGVLGADPQDVLFSGQASVPALLAGPSVAVVLVLLAAKALAYVVSLGGGFRGGPIFPAVLLGVGLAVLAGAPVGTPPTAALAIGTAAGMAAMSRLPLSALLLAALLVGRAGLEALPAAAVAATAAWLTVRALDGQPRATTT
ncbi:chloride channel protein [Cellulomonas sp. NPDC058312]|uniref:chloride channel protein n=1 Tax=Cellulomonas sp. NPDC058312 TaxID=3346441 RepID=UPI0036EC5AF3